MKGELKLLREIADCVTDLLFCGDENEKRFCEEILCRKLVKLGYVDEVGDNEYLATGKSEFLKEFWRDDDE